MKKGLALVGFASLAALAAHSVFVAPRRLQVTRLDVHLPGLPEQWIGTRIAHLSDFHFGAPGVSVEMVRSASDRAATFAPDLTFITGDFFDQGKWIEPHGALFCWERHGQVFAVLGNHDHRGGVEHVDRIAANLSTNGASLLRNDATSVELRGRTAWIAAVDDPHTRRDDLDGALANVPAGGDVLAILSHSPSVVAGMPAGAARILLAGHTHGGQIRLTRSGRIPFLKQVRAIRGLPPQPELPLARGWHWYKGAAVIVSDGIGVSTIPARFRTRPEVILIELQRARAAGPDCNDPGRYIHRLPPTRV